MQRDVVTQTAQRSRSIPREISCNLARRFPLYGVEADGLPLRAPWRLEETRIEHGMWIAKERTEYEYQQP